MNQITILRLRDDLDLAREALSKLEKEYDAQRASTASYRVQWINEHRQATLLARYIPDEIIDEIPCLSQAGWLSSEPDQPSGAIFEEHITLVKD